MSYKILCYRDRFENFKKIAAERTGNFPAKPTDDFARLVCVNSEGRVGFDKSEDASGLIGTMAIGNFWPWQDKMLCIGTPEGRYGRGYVFRPNSDAFERLVKEHEKYDLDTKKFMIMRRHGRLCPEPTPSLLSPFLTNSRRPIGRKLYKRFMEICHYVTMEPGAYEHSTGGFEVFSENLDFFFNELGQLLGQSGELIFTDHTQLPFEGLR
jgi:hypothetical protein